MNHLAIYLSTFLTARGDQGSTKVHIHHRYRERRCGLLYIYAYIHNYMIMIAWIAPIIYHAYYESAYFSLISDVIVILID